MSLYCLLSEMSFLIINVINVVNVANVQMNDILYLVIESFNRNFDMFDECLWKND
jgi:hypothetical protein